MLAQLEHLDVVLACMKELGVKTKHQKMCAFSITEDHSSRRAVGFDHDAGSIVPSLFRVDPHDSQEGEIRAVTHCQAVSGLLGLMAAASNVVTFGLLYSLLYIRPLTVVAQDQEALPEEKPVLHAQGHAVLHSCLRHVKETLVHNSGPGTGSSLSLRTLANGRIPHWLGSSHEWPAARSTICGVVAISRGTSTAWRCWTCF